MFDFCFYYYFRFGVVGALRENIYWYLPLWFYPICELIFLVLLITQLFKFLGIYLLGTIISLALAWMILYVFTNMITSLKRQVYRKDFCGEFLTQSLHILIRMIGSTHLENPLCPTKNHHPSSPRQSSQMESTTWKQPNLISCPVNPTSLNPSGIWTNPDVAIAALLILEIE